MDRGRRVRGAIVDGQVFVFVQPETVGEVDDRAEEPTFVGGGGLGLTCLVPGVTRALVVGRGLVALAELADVRAGGPRAGPAGAGAGVGRNGFAACGGGRAGAFRRNAGRLHALVTQSLLTSDTSRLKDVRGGASPWASAVANCVAVAASA
jgi:hypothetical protein